MGGEGSNPRCPYPHTSPAALTSLARTRSASISYGITLEALWSAQACQPVASSPPIWPEAPASSSRTPSLAQLAAIWGAHKRLESERKSGSEKLGPDFRFCSRGLKQFARGIQSTAAILEAVAAINLAPIKWLKEFMWCFLGSHLGFKFIILLVYYFFS